MLNHYQWTDQLTDRLDTEVTRLVTTGHLCSIYDISVFCYTLRLKLDRYYEREQTTHN